MTAAAVPAGVIYWQPIVPASGVPTTAVRLMTYGIIAVGLWLGLESTDLTAGSAGRCDRGAEPR